MNRSNVTAACRWLACLLFVPPTIALAQQSPPTRIAVLLAPAVEPPHEALPAVLFQKAANGAVQPSEPFGSSMAFTPPAPNLSDKALPINLATALSMTDARAIDIALAAERVQVASAQLQGARVLWLPTLYMGTDYFRHDGAIQDVPGNITDPSKQAFMAGVGPSAVFSFSDAIFAPLAARQTLRANQASRQTATNNSMLAVAEAYFTVQQAQGELLGAEDAVRRAQELVRRTEKLAPGLVPALEITRARTELSRRRQAIQFAREHWGLASADLIRLLRLDPATVVQPMEPPQLQVTLVDIAKPVDELIPIALTNRPELASQQALVQVSLQLLRRERIRPLVPSLLVRGASTPVTGTLAAGVFGGGPNGSMGNFGARQDWDVQLLWTLQNMGFGNRALIREKAADNRAALLQLYRVQDQVAADVVKAYTQTQTATARASEAEQGLKSALDSMQQNLAGVEQTKRAGDVIILIVRPAEVVAAVQALAQAYADYYGAIADANRAQFRLYWALGRPGGNSQAIADAITH